MITKSKIKNLIIPLLLVFMCLPVHTSEKYPAPGANRVKQGEFIQTSLLTGSLQARKAEHFIVPRTNTWQIQLKWMAKEGEMINVGDPVVRFDTSNLVSEVENLEMSLQQKKEMKLQKQANMNHQAFEVGVRLKRAEIQSKKDEIDASIPKGLEANFKYDEKKLKFKRSKQSYSDVEMEKKVKLANLKSEIMNLDLEIEEARGKLEKNQLLLKSLILTAKTKGTLVYSTLGWENRKVQVGDNVRATESIATIPDNTSLRVEAWANETGIRKIKSGQKVEFTLDAYPDRKYTGTVKDVLNSAEKRPHWGKAHYFSVIISMDSQDMTIMKPGMSVKCRVTTAHHKEAVLVPLQMVGYHGKQFRIKARGEKAVTVHRSVSQKRFAKPTWSRVSISFSSRTMISRGTPPGSKSSMS